MVNNAGDSLLGNFEEMTTTDVERQMSTNFYGVVHVMQAVLPVMRQQRSGHIINISSTAGVIGFEHCAAYAASKFAVEGLSLSIAPEVERFGIKITLVEPGFFRTELLDAQNARWSSKTEDYAIRGSVQETWAAYNGTQQGDPAKLGDALVKIAEMENPPKQFYAGSDAVAMIKPALNARLREIKDHEALSKSTDGTSSSRTT
ncbi:SDR family NAD(P)-dependent oxidoreductase [Leptolyngbya subtilissima ST-M1]|nr:SDR family NAD(P)-dependent oxidoreductase [Nodosilinea sp. FACHB-131]